MLMELQAAGALNAQGTDCEAHLKKDLQRATEHHSKQQTPYGTVVQSVHLGLDKMQDWEICHPYAFLWYLCHISEPFQKVMHDCTKDGQILRLVVYTDEMIPGNPFRPERSRTLMCIYWCFVDWPAWMLSRTFAWPCLSILRSTIIDDIPGGMSYLARVILRVFFPLEGESMRTGILIDSPVGVFCIKVTFVGWLADLVGHKELTEWKGHTGNMCCMECWNLHKSAHCSCIPGKIGLDCFDIREFKRRTSPDIHAVIDELKASKLALAPTAFAKLETERGINLTPNGLLCDDSLNDVYMPIEHMIRDWQHTICGDGVANSCIAVTIQLIKDHGFHLAHVREFMMLCHLPSRYGKPDKNWLGDTRLKDNTLSSFSSIILNLMPIIYLFLDKYCASIAELADVVRCFNVMYFICGVLATGPEQAPHHADLLRKLFAEFHELFTLLCDALKPKLHHMHHIIDGMEWLGKLLSCFVCERKHRTVKDCALHVFRHIEHTVLADVINRQCSQMIDGADLFKSQFLVKPRDLGHGLTRSSHAIIECGEVRKGDIIWMRDGRCGRIQSFVGLHDHIFADVVVFDSVTDNPAIFDERQSTQRFVDVSDIVDACTWFYNENHIVKVAIPPIFLVRM